MTNKPKPANLALSAREGVINTGLLGAAGVAGLGAALSIAAGGVWLDVTGILAGTVGVVLGLLVLPNRKRKAKKELADKLKELREELVTSLTKQFEREMSRSSQRVEETIAPFSRFVRAEQEKIGKRQESFTALEAHIVGLKTELKSMETAG